MIIDLKCKAENYFCASLMDFPEKKSFAKIMGRCIRHEQTKPIFSAKIIIPGVIALAPGSIPFLRMPVYKICYNRASVGQ
jgi:hypothetical protein